jgi:hypothetical protein
VKVFAWVLIACGFCAGTAGAAGMAWPPEPGARAFFGAGLLAMITGGFLSRTARLGSRRAGESERSRKVAFAGAITELRDLVAALERESPRLPAAELHRRLDGLLSKELFELGSRHEELAAVLGFASYARVWEGIALAERLLARAWSLVTDGHAEEALEELPLARAGLERAAEAFAATY